MNRCCATNIKGTKCKKNKIGETDYCTAHTESLQCTAIIKGSKCKCLKISDFDFCRTHKPRDTCSICLSDIHSDFKLHCGHVFCTNCIATWLHEKLSCPYCRAAVSRSDRVFAYESSTIFQLITVKRYSFTGIEMDKAEEIMIKCGLYSPEFPSDSFKDFIFANRMNKLLENEELKIFFEKLPRTECNTYVKSETKFSDTIIYQMVFPY